MKITCLLHAFVITTFFILAVYSSDPPEFPPSPSPAPELGSDDSYPVPSYSSPSPYDSPLATPPSDLSPSPSVDESSPSSFSPSPSPSPSPSEASDMAADLKSQEPKEPSSEGMSGGKKAGVAFGVIAAACFVGFGGIVYRKRQQNIRRAQYSYAARMDFI
ncbi:hypothetical protein Lser_V15G02504 [Lactuca serriola]